MPSPSPTVPRWSAVLAVYNEADYLPATLASLLAQSQRVQVIVVDNGSTDGCIAAARAQAGTDPRVTFLDEPQPGQVHALERGLAAVSTEFVAICDADTYYPPEYLARAERILTRAPGMVAACAWPGDEAARPLATLANRLHRILAAFLLPRQNHVGGPSQAFRTDVLRAAGGYSARLWPYVLKDQELMHRVLLHGRQGFAWDHWCTPSTRRDNRQAVRWTLAERLRYHLTPFARKTAFFHRWLAPRLAARGQADTVLRARPWQDR